MGAENIEELSKSLETLELENERADYIEGLDSLMVYIQNLIKFPSDAKYRSIRCMNTNFVQRLGHLAGGISCLNAVGFQPEGDFLILEDSMYQDEQCSLMEMQRELESRRKKADVQFQGQNIRLPDDHVWKSVSGAAAAEARGARSYMEDDYIMLDSFGNVSTQSFFAVYDGHGGREAVDFTVRALHQVRRCLTENPEQSPSKCFEDTYLVTDAQIRRRSILQSGSTASTVLIREEHGDRVVYSANVGDSRVVLCRQESVMRLSYDHKPSDETERAMIKEAGGFVGRFNRVNGILAISRALGDHMMKPPVSAVPYTDRVKLQDGDFIILACDGVWDVITDEQAAEFVRQKLTGGDGDELDPSKASEASKALCKMALDRRSLDNITVIVIVP